MNVRRSYILLSLIVAFVLGSASALGFELEPLTDEELDSVILTLEHTPLTKMVDEKIYSRSKKCIYATAIIPVVNPVSGKVKNQTVYISRPRNIKVAPAILIVPTIKGYYSYLEGHAAKVFCEQGMGAIVADVNDPADPVTMPSWGTEDNNHQMALHSLRTVIDYIQTQPYYDPERIGVMGFSLGGMTTAMLAGSEPRLKAIFTAAAGGNFPFILTHSAHSKIVRLRNRRMEHLKVKTIEEYEKILAEKLSYDPIYFAPRVPKDRIMMMTVRKDTRVPHDAQNELWRAWGKPTRLVYGKGHAGSIIDLVYRGMTPVVAFMRDKFDMTKLKKPVPTEEPPPNIPLNLPATAQAPTAAQ